MYDLSYKYIKFYNTPILKVKYDVVLHHKNNSNSKNKMKKIKGLIVLHLQECIRTEQLIRQLSKSK